jgi:glycosyltransferase involved in cell wall biosynthesis
MSSIKKLKIIHTEASPHWGGQEIRIFEEMKWFREQGHEMILVAPDDGTLYMRCKDAGFQVISIYFTKPRTLLNILKMLWILWRLKPDVVGTHSSTDSWAGLIAAYLLKIKKRVRYRHVSALVKGNFLNKLQYSTLSNCIITTGKCIKNILIENLKINQNKIHVLATPVRKIPDLPSKEEARRLLQKELNLEEGVRFIGQVSVLRGWKGHLYLLEAFEAVARDLIDVHLVIIGDGSMQETILQKKEKSKFQNRVHLIGYKENPCAYIRGLEIKILASVMNEGIPQALLQAMSCGVPIVLFNITKRAYLLNPGMHKVWLMQLRNYCKTITYLNKSLGNQSA